MDVIYPPVTLNNEKCPKLSIKTRILKISPYLAELGNTKVLKNFEMVTFEKSLALFALFTR